MWLDLVHNLHTSRRDWNIIYGSLHKSQINSEEVEENVWRLVDTPKRKKAVSIRWIRDSFQPDIPALHSNTYI